MLLLFYVEDLKEFVRSSYQAEERLHRALGRRERRVSNRGSQQSAWNLLLEDEVITEKEREQIAELVDYRNLVAHEIETLTADIRPNFERDFPYDPFMLARVRELSKKIHNGLARRQTVTLSLRHCHFGPAERTYEEEVARLRRKVERQVTQMRERIRKTNETLSRLPEELLNELEAWHPRHQRSNGGLTPSGRDCCDRLFHAGADPYAVGYLMGISARSARKRYRVWKSRRPEVVN